MKSDMNDLKKLVYDLIRRGDIDVTFQETNSRAIKNLLREAKEETNNNNEPEAPSADFSSHKTMNNIQDTEEIIEESLSLADKEVEMIKKALEKKFLMFYLGGERSAADLLKTQSNNLNENNNLFDCYINMRNLSLIAYLGNNTDFSKKYY